MKIRMLKTALGADTDAKGISMPVKMYEEGTEHDVCEELAGCFLKLDVAVDSTADEKKGDEETKLPAGYDEKKPSSKMKKGAPENKGA